MSEKLLKVSIFTKPKVTNMGAIYPNLGSSSFRTSRRAYITRCVAFWGKLSPLSDFEKTEVKIGCVHFS